MPSAPPELALARPVVRPGPLVADTIERAKAYARQARSPATWRAYQRQLRAFEHYCGYHGLSPAEPGSVALFLTYGADAGASVSSLAQALSAICERAKAARHPSPRLDPVVRETWAGIRRTLGVAQRQASPLSPAMLRDISRELPDTLLGLRDRALLVLGFAGGFRRSELVALDAADIEETEDGLVVHIRRSKTDQEGIGRAVGLPPGSDALTCPVRALKAWRGASGISSGALFRGVRAGQLTKRLHGKDVSRILTRAARRAGVALPALSSHSLRAGLVTTALKAGKSIHVIQAQTGHKSASMVYRYGRTIGLFDDNAASGIGL